MQTAGVVHTAEPRRHPLQFLEHLPKQGLGHPRVAFPVGMRERILARRCGPTNGRERSGIQAQRIADIVQSQGVRQLRIDQTEYVTPWLEGAALGFGIVLSCQSAHQMVGNQIAQLSQESKPTPRWLAVLTFLHHLPCGRSSIPKPPFSSPPIVSPINAVGRLCPLLKKLLV